MRFRYIDTPDFIIKHGAKLREEGKETKLLHPYMMEALRELEIGKDSFEIIGQFYQTNQRKIVKIFSRFYVVKIWGFWKFIN